MIISENLSDEEYLLERARQAKPIDLDESKVVHSDDIYTGVLKKDILEFSQF